MHSDNLRIVQITHDMSEVSGGVPAVVRQLAQRLAIDDSRKSIQIVHAVGDAGAMPGSVGVFTYPPGHAGGEWFWGRGLRAGVSRLAGASSEREHIIYHVHGSWSAPQYFASCAARKANVPFIFTAHGMLDPWLWGQQGWKIRAKKRLYWQSMAYPALRHASVIHAITPLERTHLQRLFPKTRIEVIPNAIDMTESKGHSQSERNKTILFVGRLEPKKGIDILLRAFAQAKIDKEWSVDVVGPIWSQNYMSSLKTIVEESGLGRRVRFCGPLFGERKRKLMDSAWVMAVPSHSEAMGLVNLEAAAQYLPTITTNQTGLHDWEQGGGLLINPKVAALTHALESACAWNSRERRDRGVASRHLVHKRYSWQAVMPLWLQLYNSL